MGSLVCNCNGTHVCGQLLGSMNKLPVMVRVDNIGAIFMASNITTMSCMKHVNIRYKYVNKYVEEEVVKISFSKSAKNDSNILTKKIKC